MAFKTHPRNEEIKKLAIGYTLCFLEWYGDLARYPKTWLPYDLNAAWELYLVDPNPKRLVKELQQFLDKSEEQRKSPYQIRRYISKRSKK